jgi:hypothetical protein
MAATLLFSVFSSAETPEPRDARMAWWREARFGMFIHWGLYAVPAGEWKGQPVPGIGEWIMNKARIPAADYARFAADFNPVKFDADAWASLAKAAGMRYLIITAKHHDGFAMYQSGASSFNIVDATPQPARNTASNLDSITRSRRTGITPVVRVTVGMPRSLATMIPISTPSPCRRCANCSRTTVPSQCSGMTPRAA